MKRSLLLLLLISLTFTFAQAQDSMKVQYGIRLGVNNNSTTRSSSLEENNPPEMKGFRSYSVEVVVDIPLSQVLSVQPSLELTKKGQVKKVYNSNNEQEYKVNYLQLPVNLIYKYRRFFGGAGAYAATALKGTYESGSTKEDLKFGHNYVSATSKQNDDWEQYDYGLNAILGYKIKKFTFSINYEFGLKDIDPNPYYKSRSRVGSFQVGFMF